MLVGFAFVPHVGVLFKQRLFRRRSRGLGLRFMVFEKYPAGRTAHANRQVVVGEAQQVAKRFARLQRQRSQPQRESAAHAHRRVRQAVHDAGVGECFAAAGGGHVDDEGTVLLRTLAHGGSNIGRLVLPAKTIVLRALLQAFVAFQVGQVLVEFRQEPRDLGTVLRDADQVFIQRLVGRAVLARVGQQSVTRRDYDALGVIGTFKAGVVVVGQHQAQSAQMHDERVVQRVRNGGDRWPALHGFQQTARDAGGALPPCFGGDGQAVRKSPVGLKSGRVGVAESPLVPRRL